VADLPIAAGSRLLEVSPGPGVFQPWLSEAVGPEGAVAAVDLSWGMIRRCAANTRQQVPAPLLCQGNADALPFADGAFDVLFHFGGIKLFSRPRRAFEEFARVVRPGGHVMVGDEGFAPDLPDGRRRRLMARMNPGFDHAPPAPPLQLALTSEEWVYDGYAFLWTLTRADIAA
jgi:ubiquinone/menaquinone biosynthesis C-methylase UbiE